MVPATGEQRGPGLIPSAGARGGERRRNNREIGGVATVKQDGLEHGMLGRHVYRVSPTPNGVWRIIKEGEAAARDSRGSSKRLWISFAHSSPSAAKPTPAGYRKPHPCSRCIKTRRFPIIHPTMASLFQISKSKPSSAVATGSNSLQPVHDIRPRSGNSHARPMWRLQLTWLVDEVQAKPAPTAPALAELPDIWRQHGAGDPPPRRP